MKKIMILILCFLISGCTARVENPGPPQITVLEDAVIEVNQPDFRPEQLFSYIKAVDAGGNPIPQENLSFMNNVNNTLLGTSYIKIKATDSNGHYDIETLKVTTVDKTAPEIQLPILTPVLFVNESSDWDEKAAGLILTDNFNRESTLLNEAVMIMDSVDTSIPQPVSFSITVRDSSANSSRATLDVLITDQPEVKAEYMMDMVFELTQGSRNYFTLEQGNGLTMINNYDEILDHFFTVQGREIMETSVFAQAVDLSASPVIWKGTAEDLLCKCEPLQIEKEEISEDTMQFNITMQWQTEEELITQIHSLTLVNEQGLWKIDDFYNPANGPQSDEKETD